MRCKGGKYMVLPAGYDGTVPEGYIVLRSGSFPHLLPGRTIPRDKGQKGWDAAVDCIKSFLTDDSSRALAETLSRSSTPVVPGASADLIIAV
jgi:hypothetical protein